MRFVPPFCPNRKCLFNQVRVERFARRHGRYYSAALGRSIPRFRCRGCRRTFSYCTFRFSYRQKKPHLDAAVMRVLCSGVSLRGAARLLEVNHKTVPRKLERLGRHSRSLHEALIGRAGLRGEFQLDELETFESNRFQPVTVPVLIHKKSYFVVSTQTGPLRRKGRMTPRQKRMRAEHETAFGRRPTDSDAAVTRCLKSLQQHAEGTVVLESDRKASYHRIGLRLLGSRLVHRTHSSRTRRNRANPLFAINHTNAMLRYCLARLKRRTWCVSRTRSWLQCALDMYAGWFNYCRGITNKTRVSPAQAIGLAARRLRVPEWLSWRQDWANPGAILPTGIRNAINNATLY